MIFKSLRYSWRTLKRNKIFSAVNIVGLAVGLAGFILMLLYLNYEESYDTWHPELEQVYLVEMSNKDGIMRDGHTPAILASYLNQNLSGVELATRISSGGDYEVLIDANGKKIYQKGIIEADSSFFQVFPYEMTTGAIQSVMNRPNAVVISENVAKKLFGTLNPIGQTLTMYGAIECEITGIFKKPELPSVLNTEVVFRSPWENQNNSWQNFSYQTFIKNKEQLTLSELDDRLNHLYVGKHLNKKGMEFEEYMSSSDKNVLFTEKFTELHTNPKNGGGNMLLVNILVLLAASLLVAGAINFSNLSLTASVDRAKEIGVRKIMGSSKSQLFWKFFSDIVFQILISVALAAVLVVLVLPWFKGVFDISLNLVQLSDVKLYLIIFLVLISVAALSGIYPSIISTRFNPVSVLKGQSKSKIGGFGLRNILIVSQFVLSGFFIICSIVIYNQVSFMQNKDKGFDSDQVLRIQTTQNTREQNFDSSRQRLLAISGVESVSKTTTVPGDKYIDTSSAGLKWRDKILRFNEIKVSEDYFKTIDAELLTGRWFDDRFADQHTRSAIINRSAASRFSIQNPTGEIVRFQSCDSVPIQIIGVVNDFQVQGVDRPVQPSIFLIGNEACSYRSGGAILVKVSAGNPSATIRKIETVWRTIEPDFPIRYNFLNENFERLYQEYLRVQKVVGYFTIVAILISLMGLFALSAFIIKQRKKELGIRKVLGAGSRDIFKVVSERFIIYVCIASIISIPLGFFASQKWLENFAYKFDLSWWVFASAALLLILMAIVTVGIQAFKALYENPISSLRTE